MVEKNPQKAKGACSIIRKFIGSSSNKGLGHLIQTMYFTTNKNFVTIYP